MKKITKLALAFAAATFGFTGCNSDSDNIFSVYMAGYVFQVNNDMGEPAYYTPYFQLITMYGAMESATISNGGQAPFSGIYSNYGGNKYFETTDDNVFSNISNIAGSYNVSAISDKGKVATNTYSVHAESKNALGAMNVTKFEYDNGTIKLEMDKVTNALHVGIYIEPVGSSIPVGSRVMSIFDIQLTNSTSLQYTYSKAFSWEGITADKVVIYPVVLNNTGVSILLLGEGKTLNRNGTGWE